VKPRAALDVTGDVQALEASIMDISDDITYALHDLEDFYTAGLFRGNHTAAILDDYSDKRRGTGDPPTTYQYEALETCAKDLALKGKFNQRLFDDAVDRVLTLVRFSMYRQFDGSKDAYALIRTAFASRIDFYIPRITVDKDTGKANLDPDDWHEIEVLKWLTRQFVHSRADSPSLEADGGVTGRNLSIRLSRKRRDVRVSKGRDIRVSKVSRSWRRERS
jgi:dGTPase